VESTADPQAIAEGHRSNCHLALISRERVLGVQNLGSIGENAFPEDDVALLGQIDQIALAVAHAFAYATDSGIEGPTIPGKGLLGG